MVISFSSLQRVSLSEIMAFAVVDGSKSRISPLLFQVSFDVQESSIQNCFDGASSTFCHFPVQTEGTLTIFYPHRIESLEFMSTSTPEGLTSFISVFDALNFNILESQIQLKKGTTQVSLTVSADKNGEESSPKENSMKTAAQQTVMGITCLAVLTALGTISALWVAFQRSGMLRQERFDDKSIEIPEPPTVGLEVSLSHGVPFFDATDDCLSISNQKLTEEITECTTKEESQEEISKLGPKWKHFSSSTKDVPSFWYNKSSGKTIWERPTQDA